jgi:hypothetical protein
VYEVCVYLGLTSEGQSHIFYVGDYSNKTFTLFFVVDAKASAGHCPVITELLDFSLFVLSVVLQSRTLFCIIFTDFSYQYISLNFKAYVRLVYPVNFFNTEINSATNHLKKRKHIVYKYTISIIILVSYHEFIQH